MRLTALKFAGLLSGALAIWVSSAWISDYHFYTRARPGENELAGTYIPDKNTEEYIKRRYNRSQVNTKISVTPNGRYEMVDMPWECFSKTGEWGPDLVSDKGRWQISQMGGCWEIAFESRYISLCNQKPPYVIHWIIGDPDSGNALNFIRTD